MFKNRISNYFEQDSVADAAQPGVDSPASTSKMSLTTGFAVVPTAGMFNGLNSPGMPMSIYELARRQAIERSQERLLALLRSRWDFLNG